MGITFNPDGLHVAAGVRDVTALIFLLCIEDLMELAKQGVTRSLTTEECYQHLQGTHVLLLHKLNTDLKPYISYSKIHIYRRTNTPNSP